VARDVGGELDHEQGLGFGTVVGLAMAAIAMATALVSCASEPIAGADSALAERDGERAMANLSPTMGSTAKGSVSFESTDGGLHVVAHVSGLTPGAHGFHLHEKGDCSAPDASSAGDHFNPDGNPHGSPDALPSERHVGDLGNLQAGADGLAHYDAVLPDLTLVGEHGVIGRAVVVHAGPDDFTTQPSGDAGARVACGIVVPD
jgi:Cu-Zn family superoxide dismutase